MNDAPQDPPNKSRHGEAKESGRVAFDARGNPVWEWKTSTGVFDRNVSTQRLKKLEAQDLKLEDTQALKKPKELSIKEHGGLSGGGVNPYDFGGLRSSRVSVQTHPALAHKQSAKPHADNLSLASKYANAGKQKIAANPPGLLQKIKTLFQRDK
ncbi:MAG: hypothetical protein AB7F79_12640 [Steroidobacteraceae bacterium]